MQLIIVYDNTIYNKEISLKSDWGFSCLIKDADDLFLFDTGAKGEILLNNLKNLNIDYKNISKIVISHEHWDHNGGLDVLVKYLNDVKIYRLKQKGNSNEIIFNQDTQKISNLVFSTGRLPGTPLDEQSLILKGKKGCYVLVGCSHSGVSIILQSANNFGNVIGIIGGMHGFSDFPILENMELICPCHCTKYIKKLEKLYPDKFIQGGVGRIINI
jgi:7,8-dihydropterin-6-yl-methyl-4-(beta-D-ribofuranosyl)aminobenzene 5'-phosphate synthase